MNIILSKIEHGVVMDTSLYYEGIAYVELNT